MTAVREGALGASVCDPAVRINDVVIKVATENGSGSQSANLILMRSFFTLGLPVSGKNLFPSNIQGLPTWFTIRVNEQGWLAQNNHTDILIAMNPETLAEDVESLEPGAMLIVDKVLAKLIRRNDLEVLAVPFTELVNEICEVPRTRKMVVNVVYVGAIASLLGIPLEHVNRAVDWQFARKPSAAETSRKAAMAGFQWASAHLPRQQRFMVTESDAAKGKIIIEGNEAAAIGMLFGGVTVAAWYPITPSSSLCEALQNYMKHFRRDEETNKASFAIVQAEDEIGAMATVLGAGWAGARAFTSTSGPGLSLMAELAGLSYFAEIPAVLVDIQRMGPSTGLPTRTSQGDVLKAYNLSHGDCRHIVLLPGTVEECYQFATESLDLAEEFQTLVIVLSDLDLGMNKWLSDEFQPPPGPMRRGKVLDAEALDAVTEFARYRDVDGDGIPYRTLPGTEHPRAAYFTRGTGHDESAHYSESPEIWQANMDRLIRKFDRARERTPEALIEDDGESVGLIAYGSSDLAVREARHILSARHGVQTDYMRIRALPPGPDVRLFIESHERVYVVEQNRDAQMANILRGDLPDLGARIRGILHYNGFPIDADTVVQQFMRNEMAQGIHR